MQLSDKKDANTIVRNEGSDKPAQSCHLTRAFTAHKQMGHDARKPDFWVLGTTKAQIGGV